MSGSGLAAFIRTTPTNLMMAVKTYKAKARVLRGGSFSYTARYARCAYRSGARPDDWGSYFGFRVAVSPCR